MKLVAHVIGNGPSKKDFVNEPDGDIYGCNLSSFDLPLTATFIMDKVAIDHIHNFKKELPWPIVTTHTLSRFAEQCPFPPVILDRLDATLRNGESTGHYAVLYCLRRYKEVHLWGFDSMVIDSIESDSHVKIPEGPRCHTNYKSWRTNWDKMFRSKDAAGVNVVIHRPTKNLSGPISSNG